MHRTAWGHVLLISKGVSREKSPLRLLGAATGVGLTAGTDITLQSTRSSANTRRDPWRKGHSRLPSDTDERA